ncbi:DNA ligase 1 [Helicoverpa armigera]|uniref:DNA ligase 1 n=1 Tax=Helicoverpa armigera TaxID=29058 RepID=UPI0030828815
MNWALRLVVSRVVKPARVVTRAPALMPAVPVRIARAAVASTDMAQRSITSFFKVSPPRAAMKVETTDEQEEANGDAQVDVPITNGKAKISKRPRLESSDSDASPKKENINPPPGSNKKKKVKRQRIESSGSESDASVKAAAVASSDEEPAASPTPSPKKQIQVKIEKSTSPKTYASPKSKKRKSLVVDNSTNSPSQKKAATDMFKRITPKKEIKQEQKEVKSEDETNQQDEPVNTDVQDIVPETEYNPASSKYHPVRDACWRAGQAVPYLALARTLELIEATSARLKIVDILSNYLRSVIALTPEDLLPSVYLCFNRLAPAYESLELGIAETYLMKAIGQCTGRTLAQLRGQRADLGAAAQAARLQQRTMFPPPPLTLRKVFAALKEIAHMTGHASVSKKINKIQSLYVACRHSEAKFLIRSLEGKLRIGLAEQSVLQALAAAATRTPPGPGGVTQLDAARGLSAEQFKARVDEAALVLKTTYCECPDLGQLVPALLAHGLAALPAHCRLAPGLPLKPMLAHPTKQLSHIFDRFESEQFTCEWKYDGERAQIHVPGAAELPDYARAAVFSRNQENNTSKYPDILRRLPALLKPSVWSCVLDCEAVAFDTDTKQILPFQVLSTRKRKDASEADIKVQVCVFVFDLLFLNGQSLVHQPLQQRRDALREHFNQVEGQWQFATSRDCSSIEEVQQFMEEAVRGSCEGLMVKALRGPHSRYDIARRSHNWLKLKKDYLDGVGDTVDAVVIGAYHGRGKRAAHFGGFLLACRDAAADEFQSLCKLGTGFSDEQLRSLTARLQQHVIPAPRPYYRYDEAHVPDVWVSAALVWELRAADLSLSPAHRAARGLVAPDKGISLRFPRFVRERDDKTPEQATSAQQVAQMYLAQDQVRNSAAPLHDSDEFY